MYTILLSKSDFSFALLLVTFKPLDIQQSYIPLLKALMCGNNAVGAQGSGCIFTFCHAPLRIALLLHKIAKVPYSFSETVRSGAPGKHMVGPPNFDCGPYLIGPQILKT